MELTFQTKINKGKKQIHSWPMMAEKLNTVDQDRVFDVHSQLNQVSLNAKAKIF